jgi:hypothetical protein
MKQKVSANFTAVNLEIVTEMLNLELIFIVIYSTDFSVSKLTYRKFVLETIQCRITRKNC